MVAVSISLALKTKPRGAGLFLRWFSVNQFRRDTNNLPDFIERAQVAILTHALKHPGHGYTVESHRRCHRVTLQTARTDLLALVKLKLLGQGKRGRAFVFYVPEDLRPRIESAAHKPARPAARSRCRRSGLRP